MTTNIEWTDATWNPVRGCSRVSAGCENCYAERQAIRHAGPGGHYEGLVTKRNGHPVWTGEVRYLPNKLGDPLRWRKPRRVFVNSMSDLFHPEVPTDFIEDVFRTMAASPQHTYQILTKRPRRMREVVPVVRDNILDDMKPRAPRHWYHAPALDPFRNVWLGVSVENQETADERIPLLLDTPAAVRWVSYEPALGPVDFRAIWARMPFGGRALWDVLSPRVDREACGLQDDPLAATLLADGVAQGLADAPLEPRLDWIVVGGESGPGARPCDVAWIRSAVRQCREAGVPVFVKQDSGRKPGQKGRIPDDLWIKEYPDAHS